MDIKRAAYSSKFRHVYHNFNRRLQDAGRCAMAYHAVVVVETAHIDQGSARENIHLTLLKEAARGLDDVDAGELMSVAELKSRYGRDE
jgi:hypothetical protein